MATKWQNGKTKAFIQLGIVLKMFGTALSLLSMLHCFHFNLLFEMSLSKGCFMILNVNQLLFLNDFSVFKAGKSSVKPNHLDGYNMLTV